jgi:hypothetical protein
MRKVIIMFALAMGIATANAQENVTVETTKGSEQPTLTKEVYPQKEADGDLYHGLSRKLTFDRMIPPHGLEVTYDKTVHVIFPAEVRYVDLGSPDLIAGKADGAENVIRVKATVRNFPNETNMSALTSMPCIFGRHRWACACPVKRASDAMIIAMYFLMVSALEVR